MPGNRIGNATPRDITPAAEPAAFGPVLREVAIGPCERRHPGFAVRANPRPGRLLCFDALSRPSFPRQDIAEERIGRLTHFHPQAYHPPALRVFGVPVSRSMELQLIDAMPEPQPQARGPVAIDEYAMRKSRAHRAVPVDVETG
ncbi:hypothetical protein ACFTXM_30795 [Streptomyces sp. NPDC056930]|uniref:hypothetical protein n=1 Tax=Streptomyces sp. NPDC056930 TaxID=3345967 RepID=UPI003644B0B3